MEHGLDYHTTDMVIQQCITDNHDMAQDVSDDEWLLSDEHTDFDNDMCISEPELTPKTYPEERDSMDPADEREWWSKQRRWF